MTPRNKALSVHLLTATGAVFAMLAMLAAIEAKWDLMFLWLVVAFFVDGIDGPLARKYHVKKNAPEFDGALLDLITCPTLAGPREPRLYGPHDRGPARVCASPWPVVGAFFTTSFARSRS